MFPSLVGIKGPSCQGSSGGILISLTYCLSFQTMDLLRLLVPLTALVVFFIVGIRKVFLQWVRPWYWRRWKRNLIADFQALLRARRAEFEAEWRARRAELEKALAARRAEFGAEWRANRVSISAREARQPGPYCNRIQLGWQRYQPMDFIEAPGLESISEDCEPRDIFDFEVIEIEGHWH